MAILIYRHDFSNNDFTSRIENQISGAATINNSGGFLSQLFAIDITSPDTDDTDGTNLDPFMSNLGFQRLPSAGVKILDLSTHWGSFSVADAPTTDVTSGDIGHCIDGYQGNPALVWNDGINWRLARTNEIITSTVSGATVATVTISDAGSGNPNGNYVAYQNTTSGSGFGADFNITVAGGAITVATVNNPGNNYSVSDTIQLFGQNQLLNGTLTVATTL